jgi:hypothetical protein
LSKKYKAKCFVFFFFLKKAGDYLKETKKLPKKLEISLFSLDYEINLSNSIQFVLILFTLIKTYQI